MPLALKVFRTPIGFHDAYVAAPSQKAALAAWGSDANLFARGVAEVVSDPALMAEPLAYPGEVIKRSRGSSADHFRALPKTSGKRPPPAAPAKPQQSRSPARRSPRASRPSRSKLTAAESALAKAVEKQNAALREFKSRENALHAERKRLESRHAKERTRLEDRVSDAKSGYDAALKRWRDDL